MEKEPQTLLRPIPQENCIDGVTGHHENIINTEVCSVFQKQNYRMTRTRISDLIFMEDRVEPVVRDKVLGELGYNAVHPQWQAPP